MKLRLALTAIACLLALESRADTSYQFGVLVDCSKVSEFSTRSIEVELPPLLDFLLGPDKDKLIFTSGSIGSEINAASGGSINLARNSFGLSLDAETDDFVGFHGTLEIRQPMAFCDLLEEGVILELKAAGLDVASIRLVSRETSGLKESKEAKDKTLDRIGWKYFASFETYLSDDYEWVQIWLSDLESPFDFDTYKYGYGFEPSSDRRLNLYSRSYTRRLGYPSGGVQLLKFLEQNEMYLSDFPDDKLNFQLSDLGFEIDPYDRYHKGIEVIGREGSRIIFSHGDQGVHPQWQ